MAKEMELTAKTYKEIRVVPAGTKLSGEMELSQKTIGFYITEFNTAMLGLGQSATLITEAEITKVIKNSADTWVAGDPIFWVETSTHCTNIDDGSGLLIGKALQAAGNGVVIGFVQFKDFYPVTRGHQIGTFGTPYKITATFPDPIISLYAVSAVVGNIESMKIQTVLQGIGATGGRALFGLSTEVALGGWANALKAIVDFGTTGSVSGLGSAFCAEMILPSTPPSAGNYAPLEVELRVPNSAGLGTKTSFMHLEAQAVGGGTGLALFQTNGFLMSINGVTTQTDGLFEEVNVGGVTQFDAVFRISVDGVPYFIGLCDDKTFV